MPTYLLTLEFSEPENLFLLDVTSLLYDIELAYDFCVLLTADEYKEYEFTRFFWFRNARPLKGEHRLRLVRIVKQSPLLLDVIVPSLGALWILLQIFEKVRNWNLAHEKLKLEVDKLRREQEKHREEVRELYAKELGQLFNRTQRKRQ
jgi:hypothetical protein